MDGRRNQKRRKLKWGEVPFRLPPPLKPHERIVSRAFTVHLVYAWMQMHGLKTDEYRSFSPPVPASRYMVSWVHG